MDIKICGIKNEETLLCCEENKVNYFGMIFYSKSPRNISIEQAKKLQEISSHLNIEGVGVFVDKDINTLRDFIIELKLKYVQLHGKENNSYIKQLKNLGTKIIKKISINNIKDLSKLDYYSETDFFLFDYKPNKKELPGGNAKSFDWDIVKNLEINKPWFLSGGVNINNIQLIKSQIKPFGVDLSSGVEKELGIKDNHIINKFMSEFSNA